MSQRTDSPTPAADPSDPDDGHLPGLRGEWLSGIVLARSGPLATAFLAIVALLAAVLVPFGGWTPWAVVPLLVIGLLISIWLVRFVPARTAPRWSAPAVLAIAAGHGVWAALTHAEHVILRRDAGSYALYSQWIATRHSLPIPSSLESFGGAAALADPGFRLSSPAYYQVEHGVTSADIVPQFLLGAPAVYSLGWWTAGWHGLLILPAVCSALALLGFAGLVTRLLGARWAVLATASLALIQPVLHAARSTYSEPIALLFVSVAAALLCDAVRAGNPVRHAAFLVRGVHGSNDPHAARLLGLAAGLAFGLACLFRVDGLREVSLLLPVAAVLALSRHPAARTLVGGVLGGTAVAVIPAVWLSRPYLGTISASLIPLVAGGVVLGLGSWAVVAVARRRENTTSALYTRLTTAEWHRRWPWVLGGLVALIGVVLASRPLWMITRQSPTDPGSRVVAVLQADQGLPVDGGRTYAEHSLNWISWYTGPVMLVAAWLAFAVLAATTARWWLNSRARHATTSTTGRTVGVPVWLGPAVIAFGSVLLTLYRPGITPDHPWADRRMVPVVIPALVVAATATAAWVSRRALRRWPAPALVAVVAASVVVMVLPPWLATQPVAGQRTEQGQIAAAEKVCAHLGPRDVVVALDDRAANEWPQVVRGLCDRPASSVRVTDIHDLEAVATAVKPIVARIVEAGNTPVLLAATPEGETVIETLGLEADPVVDVMSQEDQRYLTRVPDGEAELPVRVWLADATRVN
ncbi:hypothetical protein [Kineosporia succinea]|uniref:Dolichyl-phosphate-mannose-protein mannosyltransferase n=1 Tax=Kineosporia succinea TaxID=84632 RepID=A0ABT9NYA7_9ACTN|nr:hypothetical protein [Kineosporia succinea]MDP9825414.1 hypothetical protein [Kineosporia succinea]